MKSSTYFSKVSYLDKTGVEINMKENTCEHIEMLVRYCYANTFFNRREYTVWSVYLCLRRINPHKRKKMLSESVAKSNCNAK